MNKRIQCINKTTLSKDGTPIDGHQYTQVCAIDDRDTNRLYQVLQCEHCTDVSVGWTENLKHARVMSENTQLVTVGG